MTTVNITFTTSIDGVANWNEVTGQGTTGQKIADLLDDSGASTGLSLWVTTAFTNSFFSSSIATAAAHGIPEIVWDQVWYSDGSAAFEIRGFSAGQTGTIDLAGAGGNATRDTNFIVNGGSPVLYDAAGTGTPTAPVSIPFTADGSGVVNVTGAFVSSLWYLNFAVVSYTVETGPTITAATTSQQMASQPLLRSPATRMRQQASPSTVKPAATSPLFLKTPGPVPKPTATNHP